MLSNPILENLRKRCDDGSPPFSSCISVSSHGSGAATLASTIGGGEERSSSNSIKVPTRGGGGRPYSQRNNSITTNCSSSSSSNKPSWIKDDEPAAQYFVEPAYVKKERIRNSVEEWLWELRAPHPSETKKDLSMDSLLFADTSVNKTLVNFDLSKKELLDLKCVSTERRPSTPFPDPWAETPIATTDPLVISCSKEDETIVNASPPETSTKGEEGGEISPAFQNFLNQYKTGASTIKTTPPIAKSEAIKIDSPPPISPKCDFVSSSCPISSTATNLDYLYPKIQDIKCEISAKSSRSFWLEKLANYHKMIGEKVEEEAEKKKFESDLIGTENNPGEDSALLMNGAVNIPDDLDEEIFEGDRAFDRAFLSVIVDEDESEGKSSEESSGYVGSSSNEDTAKPSTIVSSNRKPSVRRKKSIVNNLNLKEDMEMLMMATKLYRQSSAGRRRRCTSTPLSSPEKPDFLKTPKLLSEILPDFPSNPVKLQ